MAGSNRVVSFIGIALARFAATGFVVLGAMVAVVNLTNGDYSGWVLATIVAAGTLGAAGGVTFLLGLDGPDRFRGFRTRRRGWVGMLAMALFPSSLTIPMGLICLAMLPLLRRDDD